MAKFKVNLNGEEREFEVTRQGNSLQVMQGSKSAVFHILHTHGPATTLEHHHQRIEVAGQAQGDKRQVWVNGRLLYYERVRQRSTGTADSSDASLSATIPAVVSKILVTVGDTVAAGDKLILLESMKMVIPIHAPYDGQVKALHCAMGDSVQAGTPLIELEKS